MAGALAPGFRGAFHGQRRGLHGARIRVHKSARASSFSLSDRANGWTIGVLRVIAGSPVGVKTINDLAHPDRPCISKRPGGRPTTPSGHLDSDGMSATLPYRSRVPAQGASASMPALYRGMYGSMRSRRHRAIGAVNRKGTVVALNDYQVSRSSRCAAWNTSRISSRPKDGQVRLRAVVLRPRTTAWSK